MSDHNIAMLNYASGMHGPIQLRVQPSQGDVFPFESLKSYVLIGRGEGSDLQLPDASVSGRHVYLQAFGTRLACIDLLSTVGLQVEGSPFQGWLKPDQTAVIGPVKFQLNEGVWGAETDLPSPLEFRPRDAYRPEFGILPLVDLELLSSTHKGMKWPINRLITLVGRDERCRITVADDRLARVECALLLLPSGLWVIDIAGGGILLNDVPTPAGLIAPGTELQIGTYKLSAHYRASPFQHMSVPPVATNDDFITRSNRILPVEIYMDTVIVYPIGDGQNFLFKDVHLESNRVNDLIQQRGLTNIIIDFSRTQAVPHTLMEGLNSICRSITGKKIVCSLTDSNLESVQNSALLKLFPVCQTLQEAVHQIYS